MKKHTKILSLLLAVIMILSAMPLTAGAEKEYNHKTTVPTGYIGIYTIDDLNNIRNNLNGKYILMNHIVFSASDFKIGNNFYNDSKGWQPIGTKTTSFNGIFDGNGYSIQNLYINSEGTDYVGLFGYINNSTIKNLELLNINFTGNNFIGGITGYSAGTSLISNCMVEGIISGNDYVGGLSGYQNARISILEETTNIIEKSINLSFIIGNNYIGGIVGKMFSTYSQDETATKSKGHTSIVEKCINSGTINGNAYVGGITGYCEGNTFSYSASKYQPKINYCFNTGKIIGKGTVAGISAYASMQIIDCCYSVGAIIAETNFAGVSNSGFISPDSSFFNPIYSYTSTKASSNLPDNHGVVKTSQEMQKESTYENWNFDTIWTMEGRDDYLYPELRDVPLYFPEEYKHSHTYESEITTPATHLTEGLMTYTCVCGDTYTEAIAKTPEHSYNAVVTAPTCTEDGYTTYICECSDTYVADYVDATDHSHTSEITTPATHLTEGLMTYTCACGDTYTEVIEKIAEHSHNAVVTAPTCTEDGYTTYTCECGDTYVADYVDATGHSHTAVVTTPATHLTEGVMTFTCACGDTYTEVIEKIAEHNYIAAEIVEPTCSREGYTVYICECGDTYTDDYVDFDYSVHVNENGDGLCDDCNELVNDCSCMCHKDGFVGFFWKILRFLYKLFDTNTVCKCGMAHY